MFMQGMWGLPAPAHGTANGFSNTVYFLNRFPGTDFYLSRWLPEPTFSKLDSSQTDFFLRRLLQSRFLPKSVTPRPTSSKIGFSKAVCLLKSGFP